MMKIFYFLVLIAAAVTLPVDEDVSCDLKPFHSLIVECHRQGDDTSACAYKRSGFINDQGKFFPDALRRLVKDYVIRPESFKIFMDYVAECINESNNHSTFRAAMRAFDNCKRSDDIENTYKSAVCDYDEDTYEVVTLPNQPK
uniref:DN4395 n=1 Tax=Habrobracon hebetor TaxID=69819 RepID=A0A455LAS7_9HYME|nr:DN4395 [Habrobracon hebetor]